MRFFKSEVERYNELMAHYDALFQSITEEIDLVKEKFTAMINRDTTLRSIGVINPMNPGLN